MTRIATFFLLLLWIGLGVAQDLTPSSASRSEVFWAHDGAAVAYLKPAPRTVKRMVDALVMATTHKATVRSAWQSLVSPQDRIGIKVMTTGNPGLNTHPSVVIAILDGLESAGINRRNVIVWDRNRRALQAAGFTAERLRCQVLAGDEEWDSKVFHTSHISGRLIWGDHKFKTFAGAFSGGGINADGYSSASHFSSVLSQKVDKMINVPLLTSRRGTGLAGALVNMTLPNVDNWRRFSGPPSFGSPDIALLYAHEAIREKVVITILDGLLAQYAGGPEFEPNYAFSQQTLYASFDPVAIDLVALDQIEQWRKMAKVPPLGKSAAHVAMAGQFGLGAISLEAVALKEVKP